MEKEEKKGMNKYTWVNNGFLNKMISLEKLDNFLVENPSFVVGQIKKPREQKEPKEPELTFKELMVMVESKKEDNVSLIPHKPNEETEVSRNSTPHRLHKLYLVEGIVQLISTGVVQRGTISSDQKRIVYAENANQALEKYNAYFANLNTAIENYVVLNAAASEAIY